MNKTIMLLLMVILGGANNSCKKKKQEALKNDLTPNSFLSGDKFKKLILEINYVEGYQPSDESINILTGFLTDRLNKPEGIEVIKRAISISGYGPNYNLTEVSEIEKKNRKSTITKSNVTAYILFLDKEYERTASTPEKVFGVNYSSSSIVIFENSIAQFSGGFGQPPRNLLEIAVIEHEFGHILGLTNNGSPMQTDHQDSAHGTHCNNKDCLMYFSIETSDVLKNMTGSSPPPLDQNCLNDLRANGGK